MAKGVLSRYLDPDVLSQVTDLHFDPRGLVIGNLAGSHKSPLSGFAVEFAGHREYVPGDDPKHIDWRVYFNRDKFFVKQYELETNFVCHLLLDISASMRYPKPKDEERSRPTRSRSCCTPRRWRRRWATPSSARATRSRWRRSTITSAGLSTPATRWTRSCG